MTSVDFDFEYFNSYTSGDDALQREVICLFFGQVPDLLEGFNADAGPKDWAASAHTIKGTARGLGFLAVADWSQHMESLKDEPEAVQQSARKDLRTALDKAHLAAENRYPGIFEDK